MSSKWRRFEVLLPLQFNDGREISPDWLADAVLEIVDHFGAASYETQKSRAIGAKVKSSIGTTW
jgi:hypothetical protein